MHEILSLALVVLGYTSPLVYSHLNLCITWDRPGVRKKKVFPSAKKMFSYLSVGIGMCSHCGGEARSVLQVQFHHSANAGCSHPGAVLQVEWQELSRQMGQQLSCCTTSPSPASECDIGCRQTDGSFPFGAVHSVVSVPQSQHPPSGAPGRCLWAPLLQANTTFSDPREGICCLSPLVEGNHLAAAQHHQKLTCECPLCLSFEQQERNRFHPRWHSTSNLAACSSLTYFINNGRSYPWSLGAVIPC